MREKTALCNPFAMRQSSAEQTLASHPTKVLALLQVFDTCSSKSKYVERKLFLLSLDRPLCISIV